MKRNSFITYLFGSACMLGACTTTVVDEPDIQDTAINFSTPNARAVIEGKLPAGSSFKIWGYHTLTEGQGISEVFADFEGEKVTELNGQWTYTGGTRYWIPRYTYNFYALYPFYPTESQNEEETIASCDADGNLTVTNFDCSKTGKEAIDLMTAFPEPIPFSEGQMAQPVGLTFKHGLARLKFTIKTKSHSITLKEARVYGLVNTGTFNSKSNPSWSKLGEPLTEENTPYKELTETPIGVNQAYSLFGDFMIIPQQLSEGIKLGLKYEYDNEPGKPYTQLLSLKTDKVTEWIKSKSYSYVVTIPENTADVELNVSVLNWDEIDTSVQW